MQGGHLGAGGAIAVDTHFERIEADALDHDDEALGVAVALGQIGAHQLLDDVGNLGARERRADDPADGRPARAQDAAFVVGLIGAATLAPAAPIAGPPATTGARPPPPGRRCP